MSGGPAVPSPPTTRLLLRGRPGIGKTTVARRLIGLLVESGIPVAGFTTDEVRDGGRRQGFVVVPAGGGPEATLAHVNLPGPPRVGRYGVDLAAFERVALPALRSDDGVVVIDELGRMELASEPFCRAVDDLLDAPIPVVATVHAHRHPFTDELAAREDVEVLEVTREVRDRLPAILAARLRDALAR